jgi:hypothetical protein
MYAPSSDVHGEMTVTRIGLWIDRCGRRGRDLALLLKCPTHIAKSIRKGSPISLVLADVPSGDKAVRCVGLQIQDRTGKPMTTFSACRTHGEQRLLSRAFQRENLPLFVFDEIERCVAGCRLTIDQCDREALNAAVQEWPLPYAGRFCSVVKTALDQFDEMLDRISAQPGIRGPITAACSLDEWKTTSIYGVGSGDFNLEGNDGSGLEQTVHQLLESLFDENAFRSPNALQTNGSRELIDSLLVGDHVLCLVESKAVGFVNDEFSVDPDRLAKRVLKDVNKGLNQLKGATRAIRSGTPITGTHRDITGLARTSSEPIPIPNREWVVLGIVVVSDLECGVDWCEVAKRYLAASGEKVFYQVVDLAELRGLVGAARTRMQFVTNLILRWHHVKDHATMGMRVRIRRESGK